LEGRGEATRRLKENALGGGKIKEQKGRFGKKEKGEGKEKCELIWFNARDNSKSGKNWVTRGKKKNTTKQKGNLNKMSKEGKNQQIRGHPIKLEPE